MPKFIGLLMLMMWLLFLAIFFSSEVSLAGEGWKYDPRYPATEVSLPPVATTQPTKGEQTKESEFFGGRNLSEYMTNIYNWSIGIAAGLAVIMLIHAGYLYTTSAGNPENITQAKEIVIGAISGLVLLILVVLILRALGVGSNVLE